MKRRFWMLFTFGLCLFLTACASASTPAPTPEYSDDFTPLISVTGKVVPQVWATLGGQSGGMVAEILVAEGDQVAAGDLLLRLDDRDASVALLQAEAALAVAEAQLARIQVGPRDAELAVAEAQLQSVQALLSQAAGQRDQLNSGVTEADIAAAEAAVAAAQAEQLVARQRHDDTMKCYDVPRPDGSVEKACPALGTLEEQARFALNAADEALAAAQARLSATQSGAGAQLRSADAGVWAASAQRDAAQAQLDLLAAGALDEDVAISRATLEQAAASVEAARLALERTEVRAPFAGTIGMLQVRSGEFVAPGQPLITLGDLTTLRVETTDLDEIDVGQVFEGQMVTLSFEAFPERLFEGQVQHIAPMADPSGGGVNYKVLIDVVDLEPLIRWGMTAFVDIEGAE